MPRNVFKKYELKYKNHQFARAKSNFSTSSNEETAKNYFYDSGESKVKVFASKEDFENNIMLKEIEHELYGTKFSINKIFKKFYTDKSFSVFRKAFPPSELHYFNNEGMLVVGDMLYEITTKEFKKTDMVSENSESYPMEQDVIANYIMPPDDGGGGGGGGGGSSNLPGWDCTKSSDIYSGSNAHRQCYYAQDTNDDQWEMQLYWGNLSWTTGLGIRRSTAWSKNLFYYPGTSNPSGPPSNVSTLFPNTNYVKVEMHFSAKIGIDFTCDNYTRSDSGDFLSERTKGRCANTGVTSNHWITFNGQDFLIDYYEN